MPTIFVSHSSKNDTFVDRIHDALEKAGIDTWVDHRDIQPAENWNRAVDAALRACPLFLLALSKEAVASEEVEGEWRTAITNGRQLLVAAIDALPPEDVPYRLHNVQRVDLFTKWETDLPRLIAAITGDKSTIDAPHFSVWPLTGTIARVLTQIPIRGREEDITEVLEHLRQGPTVICGTGGLGKSRLAAEIALHSPDVGGALWLRIEDVSSPDAIYELLRRHFDLEATVDPADVLDRLRGHQRLIVLDNAESVPVARRADYVRLVDALIDTGAQVLLTSRLRWDDGDAEIALVHHYTPRSLPLDAAAQIVRDMAEAYAVPVDVTPHAERIAAACRNHPRLIEWAIKLLRKRGLNDVVAEFEGMKGKKLDEALDDILHRTLRQMTAEVGPEPEAALRKLVVFRGGFTRTTAEAVLGDESGDLSDTLDTLQSWPFVTIEHQKDGSARYSVDPLAIEALDAGLDEAIREAHYSYYKALAREHEKSQDFAELDPDSANLEAAFEWAIDAERYGDAYWLREACTMFQANRGRFAQRMDWIERVAAVLQDTPDDHLRGAVQNSLSTVYQNHPFGDRQANLHHAVEANIEALRFFTAEKDSLHYALAQNTLGNAYGDLAAIEDRAANLERAITAFKEALRFRTPEAAPLDYAMTQNNLGNAYRVLAAIEDQATHLERAIAAYTEALRFYTPENVSLAYATTQNNLGNAYSDLAAIEDRTVNLGRAIVAYTEALCFRTPETAPLDYAKTQNNLGIIYWALADIEDKAANLKRAIAACTEALRFLTPETAPLDYAKTQNDLGIIYWTLADIEDSAVNRARAITAFKEALCFRTPETAPLDYATTQYNLGNAYGDLAAIEDRAANLKRTIAAYSEALRFYIPDAAPLDYAKTQTNLGLAYEASDDLPAAIAAWKEAEHYRRLLGYDKRADTILSWIAEAEAQLAEEGDDEAK